MFKETLLEKYKDTLKNKFKKLNNKLQLAVAQMALHPWWCWEVVGSIFRVYFTKEKVKNQIFFAYKRN